MFNPNAFSLSCLLLFLPMCSGIDKITDASPILDSQRNTLVSQDGRFELGFFTPKTGSTVRRYVGIWYRDYEPKKVVWVANRDKPLPDDTGSFGFASDGNLVVLSIDTNTIYWCSNITSSSSLNSTAQLQDSGNLVIGGPSKKDKKWQSFDHPTDTFLPGMTLGTLKLSSWKGRDDPAVGNYTFTRNQGSEGQDQYTIYQDQILYWKSGIYEKYIPSDDLPQTMTSLLSNTLSRRAVINYSGINITTVDYNNSMISLTFDGFIQYFVRNERTSTLILGLSEPKDRCRKSNPCGLSGICNTEDIVPCKCLPGFEPQYPEYWQNGDYSSGCISKSPYGKEFLNLTMMKAANPVDGVSVSNETECKDRCLKDLKCRAFSYIEDISSKRGQPDRTCWRWREDLQNVQELAEDGRNLSVRVSLQAIGVTNTTCQLCGTNLIPYPLSVGANCGDELYSAFRCNASDGQLYFNTASGDFRVAKINTEMHFFSVHLEQSTPCNAFKEADFGPFYFKKCTIIKNDFSYSLSPPNPEWLEELDMEWKLPVMEPTCDSNDDCQDWPHTSCSLGGDGKNRCRCHFNSRWNSTISNCTTGFVGSTDPKGPQHKHKSLGFISLIAIPIAVIVIAFMLHMKRKKQLRNQMKREKVPGEAAFHMYDSERRVKELISSSQFGEDEKKGIDIPFFDLDVILGATDNFSDANKLGQGGFGPVYKGTFPGGQEIAVKRLRSGSGQGLEEFKNEVMLIAKLQHRNLVRLLGYCIEGDEKILLYEYMPNKSLDSFIFDRTRCMLLTWEMRLYIIVGIARGMLYLHQDSRLRIIHRDLKVSNVLLDEEMNPKISDFGLARIFEAKQTEATTQRVIGTYGYMSPEYALDGFFSIKSDVFSFGVVILEIISGKRNTGYYLPEGQLNLLSHAWRLWTENNALNLIDRVMDETCDRGEVIKCINVALLCVQEDPNDRPMMSNVLFMLGGEITTLPTPKQPAFALKPSHSGASSSSSSRLDKSIFMSTTMAQGR